MARIRLKYVNGFDGRDGRVRYYFRRGRGSKAIALPGLPGSEEFMQAYGVALATNVGNDIVEIGASKTLPGTINALVVVYYRSSAWGALEEETRKTRWRIIERFREKHGDKRVALLRHEHILNMLGEIERPAAKRHWLKAIRGLLRAGIPSMRKDDPTVGIAGIKMPKTRGHHCWTDTEVEQYRTHWPLGTQQRLVMDFALETASRKGEVVRLGPQHVQNGRIRIERTHGSNDVDIPMSPELQAACDAMPRAHLTYVVTAHGRPRSKYGLGNDFAKWATEAGVPARCRMHGLKKGGMRRLAEDGVTTHELMAISGHVTLSEVERYTADADRLRLADQAGSGQWRRREQNGPMVTQTRRPHYTNNRRKPNRMGTFACPS
jgi:integrase